MKKRAIVLVVFLSLVLPFLPLFQGKAALGKETLRKAPDFELVDLRGRTISLSSLEGKVVIVDVWDTWCSPCWQEIPDFIDLHTRFKSRGFVMIGVALGNKGEDAVRSFVEENGIRYKVALATPKFLEDYSPIEYIPTTFVIDKKGRIAATYSGFKEKAVFEEDILRLLKE
jgi:peroxiredoxin